MIDVTSTKDCTDVLNEVASRHTLSGLFNCAGINPTSLPLTNVTDEYLYVAYHRAWHPMLQVLLKNLLTYCSDLLVNTNLRGTFNMTRAIIPLLAPNAGCSIVNVSSSAGIRASAGFAIYNMTKFGIIGFSKSMALELGPQGIRCNVVAPGPIDTPTNAAVVAGKEAIKRQEGNVAMGRLGRPEEVADVVTFLFGDGARFMNGSVVEVNGGL